MDPKYPLKIRVTAYERAYAAAIGRGSVSFGMGLILDFHRKAHPDVVVEVPASREAEPGPAAVVQLRPSGKNEPPGIF